jgi:polyisoprenoid-binding protein YceI
MDTSTEVSAPELIGTWDIDPNHSTLEAIARYAMLSNVRGHFDRFSGAITVGRTLAESRVEVEIDAASINTGVDMRDNHLRSADSMDVENHPKITLRGVTKEIELDVRFEGIGPDPWANTRAGLLATTIHRKDFGASWNAVLETRGVLVGESLNISAIKRKTDADAAATAGEAAAEAVGDVPG